VLAHFGAVAGAQTINYLATALPELVGALAPILSVQERHGCVGRTEITGLPRRTPTRISDEWRMTQFGRECLDFLTGEPKPDRL
jgi:hypothetical protein